MSLNDILQAKSQLKFNQLADQLSDRKLKRLIILTIITMIQEGLFL